MSIPAHCNNVAVDMYALSDNKPPVECLDEKELEEVKSILLPGCLPPPDEACPQLLEDMIRLPEKKALKTVERYLKCDKTSCDPVYILVSSWNCHCFAVI